MIPAARASQLVFSNCPRVKNFMSARKRKGEQEEVEDAEILSQIFAALGSHMKKRSMARCLAFSHSQITNLQCKIERIVGLRVTQASVSPLDGRPSYVEYSTTTDTYKISPANIKCLAEDLMRTFEYTKPFCSFGKHTPMTLSWNEDDSCNVDNLFPPTGTGSQQMPYVKRVYTNRIALNIDIETGIGLLKIKGEIPLWATSPDGERHENFIRDAVVQDKKFVDLPGCHVNWTQFSLSVKW